MQQKTSCPGTAQVLGVYQTAVARCDAGKTDDDVNHGGFGGPGGGQVPLPRLSPINAWCTSSGTSSLAAELGGPPPPSTFTTRRRFALHSNVNSPSVDNKADVLGLEEESSCFSYSGLWQLWQGSSDANPGHIRPPTSLVLPGYGSVLQFSYRDRYLCWSESALFLDENIAANAALSLMENHGDPTPATASPNGLRKVFTMQNRSRTALAKPDTPETDQRNRSSTIDSKSEDSRPTTSSAASGHSDAPSGISKLIPGARRRHRKKVESATSLNKDTEQVEGYDWQEGESKASLPSVEINGQRRRSMTNPESNHVSDGSESDIHSTVGSRNSRGDPTASTPDLGVYKDDHDSNIGGRSNTTSEISLDSFKGPSRNATALGIAAGSNSGRGSISSSTSRKLKEAFTHRITNKSNDTSPDRSSGKLPGNNDGNASTDGIASLPSRRAPPPLQTAPQLPPPNAQAQPPLDAGRQRAGKNTPLDEAPKTPPPLRNQPDIVTTLTPPTPTNHRFNSQHFPLTDIVNSPESTENDPSTSNIVVSPSGNMISHRRVRSASAAHQPSKLSSSTVPPLTPAIEENKSQGRTSTSQFGTGFFSSMVSAAQNAATTLSSSLNPQVKSRNTPDQTDGEKRENVGNDAQETSREGDENAVPEDRKKEPAVNTLGKGDLDFSHLGLEPPESTAGTTADNNEGKRLDVVARPRAKTVSQRDELSARMEDVRAARAVSMAYGNAPPTPIVTVDGIHPEAQPQAQPQNALGSLIRDNAGENTPPGGSVHSENAESLKQNGSLKSRRARRTRGSSAATTNTLGATNGGALGANLAARNTSVPRLTGFAVASKKRNRDFHQLFRSVPEDDYLIEDYSCALQREIILAGRLYISEGHICFSSNILGWVTTLVIGFDEVIAIEKESTAMVFPNAIAIQSLHARHTFRSLLSRDATYDLIINIWKINHPTLKSSINGTHIDQGTGDKTEKADDAYDESASNSEDDDEVYDEDEDGAAIDPDGSVDDSVAGSEQPDQAQRLPRKSSTTPLSAAGATQPTGPTDEVKSGENGASSSAEFPGPKTHAPTEYNDPSGRYEKLIKDEIIPAPLGQVYSLVFGAPSGAFMSKFLLEFQKVTDLQFEDDKKGLTNDNKTRSYNYIKPLNGAIGPKQTRCISSEQLDLLDFDKAILVTLTTQTPDVPSGNVFSVKTKYLLTWAPSNATRLVMSCNVEWTGKSWIKGPIEKGANDGQLGFGNDLVKAVRAAVAARGPGVKGGPKGKGRRIRMAAELAVAAKEQAALEATKSQAANQGILSSLYSPFAPIVDLIQPLWSSNMTIGVLLFLLVTMWLRTSVLPHRAPGVGLSSRSAPERLIALEELWQREENELWDWLEERVGLDGLAFPVVDDVHSGTGKQRQSNRGRTEKEFENRLHRERMSEREAENAIRVTQERLETLQRVVEKRKQNRQASLEDETPSS
ncbi:GRAM domain-containing protein YSP2 [Arthroderma uncinatum]|uniref:GRAM domain-containing protein YSP2 n=1 Tax=Arthroderma uncinatum TaxID=74035 RepID=UPI00144AD7E3|nr:GRAM domain-containing protein YSP2 [Arthroderma uncinatum]KAF3482473.1 GRAM domain-containing protein YSP2 [Arthroderma uncinatum]